MPWTPRQCRYFETDTAKRQGVPAKLRRECHDQARGHARREGPRTRALRARAR